MKFRIDFVIKGHALIEAASRHEAMTKFDDASDKEGIEHFIKDGYDDVVAYEPEAAEGETP